MNLAQSLSMVEKSSRLRPLPSSLAAQYGAPHETDKKVQAPSDLARQKGVLPVGKWMGRKQTDTTVNLPSDLIGDMGVINRPKGSQLPSAIIRDKAKPMDGLHNVVARAFEAAGIDAGGPGSGRHKTGLSIAQKQSVVHLRRAGFKSSAVHSVDGTHAMTKQVGNRTHVFNLSKGGFTHSVTTNSAGTKFNTGSAGTHKQLSDYLGSKPKLMASEDLDAGGPGSGPKPHSFQRPAANDDDLHPRCATCGKSIRHSPHKGLPVDNSLADAHNKKYGLSTKFAMNKKIG